MGNLRDLAKKWNYSEINREERNLCAILYHLLLINDNMRRFMNVLGNPFGSECEVESIFVEYAFARDLWNSIDGENANQRKKDFILEQLSLKNDGRFGSNMTIKEFNDIFGAAPRASETHIQSPGRWTVKRIDEEFPDPEEFRKICKFKWAFNVKPDIVIHVDADHAICIEAKVESGEGQYPQASQEKAIFAEKFGVSSRLNSTYVTQTSVQEYLMEVLLGLDTKYYFLQKDSNRPKKDCNSITWKNAFSAMDMKDTPAFLSRMLAGHLNREPDTVPEAERNQS